jgi:hypothetical protein
MGQTLKKQPGAELYPFMEMAFAEVESVKFESEGADRDQCRVGSQVETERASRSEIEAERSSLKKNYAPAATLSEKLEPDAATTLSQLGARRKKSPVSLADIEAILEIIEES